MIHQFTHIEPSSTSSAMGSPPQPLEPPLLSSNTRYDTALLRQNATASSHIKTAIKLPAIRSWFSFPTYHGHGTSDVHPPFLYASNFRTASCSDPDLALSPLLSESARSTRSASVARTEPKFAKLLSAGCDMKVVLEAMDQELLPKDILGLFRVDLARPPMPEEPVSDPDYKPRPSPDTGKPPADANHSKKETERRAQHKHYLDLSEIKIPDFFLRLCGWEEPRGSGTKRTPRTKSSVLQAGCLFMWFLSGPVSRCLQTLLQNNDYLKEKVQRLESNNYDLRLRCQRLQLEGRIIVEHTDATGGEPTKQSPCLAPSGSHSFPTASTPSSSGFKILEDSGLSLKPGSSLSPPSDHPRRALPSSKRRTSSASSHGELDPASPPKKRKTHLDFIANQGGVMRLHIDDDIENSVPDIDGVRDQNKNDLTPTRLYRLRLSSAPSLQSATPSCWDSASIISTGSSWDQPSPSSTADA